MKTFAVAAAAGVLLALPLAGQQPTPAQSPNAPLPPNAPHYVKTLQASGVTLRFLDFKWDEAAFTALETGGDHPAARRSWALATIVFERTPRKWNGKTIGVGACILVLNPSKGGAPATLELRGFDYRDIFKDLNVIATPPPGDTYKTEPVAFEKVASVARRLEMTMEPKGETLVITVHYGDRQTVVTLTR